MFTNYHMGIFDGVHISRDYEPQLTKVFHWLTEQAEAGDARAMTNLGIMYAVGLGTPFDTSQSFHWFKQAAAQEDPAGIHNTGRSYELGEGAPYDPDLAVVYYEQAAALGFVPAMLAKAAWLENPRQYYSTEKEIFEAYKAPAALNSPKALYKLGLCYKNGTGITKNTKKSIELLTQAAEMNDCSAQVALRDYYCHKPADRPTKVCKPKPGTDREIAIVWNFVLCTLHGTLDGLAQYLLPFADRLCLAYPEAALELGPRKLNNDIFRAIHAYQHQQRIEFIESRRWTEASGIQALYPDSINQHLEESSNG